jgi:hypothetical protein
VDAVFELFEFEGAIVARGRQAEAVVDEVLLAALVAVPHAVDLGNGGVALVDEEQEVAGEVVEEGGRGLAGQTAAEVARVVLDAVAVAHGLDHLEVEAGALIDALGLDHAAFGFKLGNPLVELFEDGVDGLGLALGLDDVVALGIDGQAGVALLDGAEERIDLREGLDFVAEHLDAVGGFVVGGEDFDDVAADAEGAAAEVGVVALVEDFDEAAGDVFAGDALALFEEQQHAVVGLGRAEAVDATDGADDDGVAALEERARGGEAELVELFVDGGFFFDVEVAGGDVGLGLVVVVVADEVLDGVAGEELLELVIELGGEGLVVGEDEGGAVGGLDDLGHGEGLAGAGDAEQDLVALAGAQTGEELLDGAGLVSFRFVGGDELEVHGEIIRWERRISEDKLRVWGMSGNWGLPPIRTKTLGVDGVSQVPKGEGPEAPGTFR